MSVIPEYMQILLLSRYGSLGASSRVRYLQYLPYFRSQGVNVSVEPLFSDDYLRALYGNRSRWREALAGFWRRILTLISVRQFDVVIIEKELFPFFPAMFERLLPRLHVPYVVDYDDALFHRYDLHSRASVRRLLGHKIDAVMRNAAVVIAGNGYLADRAQAAGARRIEIVPTVVDADRYVPACKITDGPPIVGWIGTPKTSRYLEPLLPTFERIRKKMSVRFVAIGAREADFADSPVEILPWSEETEVASIQTFDVGIMPLPDNPWERGKCGYKLIQYMACGIPVVASPVGVNQQIVEHNKNGLLAESAADWEHAISYLLMSGRPARLAMGACGRERVEAWYSSQVQARRLIQYIREAADCYAVS